MRRIVRSLLAAAAVAVLAAGCSSTIDTPGLEKQLAEQLGARLNTPEGTVTWEVSCPEDVEPSKGDTFGCTATGTDEVTGRTRSLRIEVTQKDDQGQVTWRIAGEG
jgi:hypothetical protein